MWWVVSFITGNVEKCGENLTSHDFDEIDCADLEEIWFIGKHFANGDENDTDEAFMRTVVRRCLSHIRILRMEYPTDELFEIIGIDADTVTNVEKLTIIGPYDGRVRLEPNFRHATTVTIYDGELEFIDGAKHVQQLEISSIFISLGHIIQFVLVNDGLVQCAIEIDDDLVLRAHNSLFNTRMFQKLHVKSNTNSRNYFELYSTNGIVISSDHDILSAYDDYRLLQYGQITNFEHFLDTMMRFRQQFEMFSAFTMRSSNLSSMLFYRDIAAIKVTVHRQSGSIYGSFNRIGGHYVVNIGHSDLFQYLKYDMQGLTIFSSARNSNVAPILHSEHLCTLTISKEWINDNIDPHKHVRTPLGNSILNRISEQLNSKIHLSKLERIETDLFESDGINVYKNLFQLPKLSSFIIRFTEAEEARAGELLRDFHSLGISWQFEISCRRIIGRKVISIEAHNFY